MQLYDQETSQQILNTHLPKMASHATPDKIIWPPSTNGEYQVKKAYDILHQTVSPTNNLNDSQAKPSSGKTCGSFQFQTKSSLSLGNSYTKHYQSKLK